MQMTTVDLIPARTIRRPVELHRATVRGSARLALVGAAGIGPADHRAAPGR